MLTHSDIWRAIDRLAREYGLTPSGLARRSGLDPTTFNKSKRANRDGKLRWPSTESIAKILTATGADLGEFVSYAGSAPPAGAVPTIPLLGLVKAAEDGHFSEQGRPRGDAWDEVSFPDPDDTGAFALEIAGHAFEPIYRDGDIIVISPQAEIRRGDRVVLRTRGAGDPPRDGTATGETIIGVLRRRSVHVIDVAPLGASLDGTGGERNFSVTEVAWMARIVWSSQ